MQKKKAMVFGTFDIIHPGHLNFFKQAKKYGQYLIVVVARDKTVHNIKKKLPRNNERVRLNNIINKNIAQKVVLGNLNDKYKRIKEFKPNVICLGYDQKNFVEDLRARLKKFGLKTKVIKLKSYKPDIYKSSKLIKN